MQTGKLMLFVFILFFSLPSDMYAQHDRSNSNDSDNIVNAKYRYFSLNRYKEDILKTKLPFYRIIYKDVRYDTTFIAINWQSAGNRSVSTASVNKKFNLDSGLAYSLTNYFNCYNPNTSPDTSNALICYIKSFSISAKDTSLDILIPKSRKPAAKTTS